MAQSQFTTADLKWELTRDEESDEKWISLLIVVMDSLDDFLSAKAQYAAKWVSLVPWPQRHMVRLSYSIA